MSIYMKVFWLSVVASLVASLAVAEKVVVRSGEHDGFSRFVAHLPQRVDWTLSGTGSSRNLVLRTSAIEWDLDQAFMRISDKRIRGIAPVPDGVGLAIDLNCNCKVDAFWHGQSMLVVDVSDDKFADRSKASTGRDSKQDAEDSKSQMPGFRESRGPGNLDASQQTAIWLVGESLSKTVKHIEDDVREPHAPTSAARKDIAKQFGRAASLGLVDLAVRVNGAIRVPASEDVLPSRAASAEETQLKEAMSFRNTNSYTSADPFLGNEDRSAAHDHKGISCVSDDQISIENWGSDESFSFQIGAARRKVTELTDMAYHESELNMARLYLYFGFGAEAESILTGKWLGGDGLDVYIAISQILDAGKTKIGVFEGQIACNSDVALWAALHSNDDETLKIANIDAILLALSSFPDHLINLVAPRLIEKFQRNGQVSASGRVFRLLNRSSGDDKFEWMSINLNEDVPEQSERTLVSIVDGNSDISPLILVSLIDNKLEGNSDIPRSWVDLVGSYAHEQRETEVGETLDHRYMRALAASGQYELAFAKIDSFKFDVLDEDLARSADVIVSYTIRNADDVTFLKHLGYRGRKRELKLSRLVENEVASRLLELGFPSEALDYLTGNAEGTNQEERRLLRAEASLAMGAPREAIGSLLGMSGVAVDALRGEAINQWSFQMDASPLSAAAGDGESALRQPLLADDRQEVARSADAELAEVLHIADQTNAEKKVKAPLAKGDALLAESESIRDGIMRMLEPSEIFGDGLR